MRSVLPSNSAGFALSRRVAVEIGTALLEKDEVRLCQPVSEDFPRPVVDRECRRDNPDAGLFVRGGLVFCRAVGKIRRAFWRTRPNLPKPNICNAVAF